MDCPVTVDDVAARFAGTMSADQIRVAQATLDDAWEQVVARVPGVESRYASGALRPGLLVSVLCAQVISVVKNPDGWARESIDDWSGQRDTATSSGKISFSDDDLLPLFPLINVSQAFSIVPS